MVAMQPIRGQQPSTTDHHQARHTPDHNSKVALQSKPDHRGSAILPWHVLLVAFVVVQAYSLRTLLVYPPSILSTSDDHQQREWPGRAELASAAEQPGFDLERAGSGEERKSADGWEQGDALGTRGRHERHLLSESGQKKKKSGVTTAEDVENFLRRRFPSCKLEYIGGQPGQAKEKGEGIVWPVCSDHLRPRGVVYSFGVGPNLLFEGEMTLRGQQVFVFDPFVNDTAFASLLQPIKGLTPRRSPQFRPFALGPRDGVALFHPIAAGSSFSASSAASSSSSQETREAAVLRLRTFMCMHSHRWIDILRLDIAGLELDLCEDAAAGGGGNAFGTSVGDLTRHGAAALAEKTPVGPTPGSVPIGQVVVRFHAELAGRDGARRRRKCEETFAAWGLKRVHAMGDGSTVLFARTDAAAAF